MKEEFELQLPDLLFFVKESCHENLHAVISELRDLCDDVTILEKGNPSFPIELPAFAKAFINDINIHLTLEETNLFPLIESGNPRKRSTPLEHLESDHDQMKDNLLKIRRMTDNYQAPEECNLKVSNFYDMLKEIDRIVLNHIQIENFILFPMVRGRI